MAALNKNSSEPRAPRRPATTPEAREKQMVSLAYDVAQKQMERGEASSQIISHFLKLGTTREKLEQEKLAHENALLQARKEQIESQANMEDLFKDAIAAMKTYKGEDFTDVHSE